MAALTRLGVPGSPEAWRALAFDVAGTVAVVGHVALDLDVVQASWAFDEVSGDASVLGVPTARAVPPPGSGVLHANGVDRIDHVVYAVPDLDEGVAALTAVLGIQPRRRARPRPEGPEMAFLRAGEAVLEVVGAGAGPALWGVAFRAPDLDATVAAVREAGGPIGDPKPAVQGGRIASVWQGHVGFRIAVMEPASSL
jgi:catechol 2,3-dioxygenase-like lactoylglutathione lyase family enzyme